MAGFRSRVADVLSAIKGSTIEPQSVNTDRAKTTGNSEVTTFWGTEGDIIPLYSQAYIGSDTATVTSQTFNQVGDTQDQFPVRVDSDSRPTNTVNTYFRFVTFVSLGSGATQLKVRGRETPATEVTADRDGFFLSDWGEWNTGQTGYLEAKVDADEASLRNMNVIIGAEIS